MMTVEQANDELKRVTKAKGGDLLLKGPETINRPRPEIPEWVPPGVYEFQWSIPEGEGRRVELSGKVAVPVPEPEEDPEPVHSGGMFMDDGSLPPGISQMFALSQQIANIRASAKDDFYSSMITLVKENNVTLSEERKKMREEVFAERKEWLKLQQEMRTPVSIDPPEQSTIDTIKEILSMPEVRPLAQFLIQRGIAKVAGVEINPMPPGGES